MFIIDVTNVESKVPCDTMLGNIKIMFGETKGNLERKCIAVKVITCVIFGCVRFLYFMLYFSL